MFISPLVCVETTEEHKTITSRIPDDVILADDVSSVTFDIAVFHCLLLLDLSEDKGETFRRTSVRGVYVLGVLLESSCVRECSTDMCDHHPNTKLLIALL